jgi:hypothetical protein
MEAWQKQKKYDKKEMNATTLNDDDDDDDAICVCVCVL